LLLQKYRGLRDEVIERRDGGKQHASVIRKRRKTFPGKREPGEDMGIFTLTKEGHISTCWAVEYHAF